MTEQSPASRREVPAFGPYATESDAMSDARDVLALPPDAARRANDAKLFTACVKAGVALGEYDEQVIAWLAKWEPQAVQVIIGLITRAGRQDIADLPAEAGQPTAEWYQAGEDWIVECAPCGYRERNFESAEDARRAAAAHRCP